MTSKLPVISVITVVYNSVSTLERTILSILGQTYSNVEYIIIDGGSIDGTKDLIQKYACRISKWVSEPDKGLYDAMNKGINLSTGDYLWFINSGDEIAAPDVIERIMAISTSADIYYGETVVVDTAGDVLGNRRLKPPLNLNWKHFSKGMLVSHQSVIIKKEICNYYNTSFRFSADFEWVLSALKKSTKTVNTQMVISVFLEGGLTRKNIIPGLKERFKIMANHFGLFRTIFNHFGIAFRFMVYYMKHGRF